MPRDTHALVTTRFSAYAADGRVHPAPGASSFEEAALQFVDQWHPAVNAEGEVTLYVIDQATGREQCFTVDIDTGEAGSCH